MEKANEFILSQRMHGLYLSRKCSDITKLSRELLGLHCWFHRNVVFSAMIRGSRLGGWEEALVKTWLYRGTLHGAAPDDLPDLLALHTNGSYLDNFFGRDKIKEIADKVIELMGDGVYSRKEMREIFAFDYDRQTIEWVLSPWGGIFVELARLGKVAFRNMTSRDFDLIDSEPVHTAAEVLPGLFHRYITAYGPATITDAAWFFGLGKERKKELTALDLSEYKNFEHNKSIYYYIEKEDNGIPEFTLLSGFDPLIVSYTDRSAVLPSEYKNVVILKSGICLPTIAVNGQVAGLWNIKKKEPFVEFFETQPKRIQNAAWEAVESAVLTAQNYL